MSWLFSQALVAEYLADTCSDGAPSAPLSTTPTPQAYLWRGKTMDAWRRFPSGMTSAPLTDDRGEAVLTSFLEGSRAKTSAAPARAQASPASAADSGARWRESSVRYDRDSSSWKTHRCLFIEDLPSSSVTLPRWGMMRDGVCWELTTSERPTSGTESGSLLPTPTATPVADGDRTTNYAQGGTSLGFAVRNWPTPVASDGKKDPSGSLSRAVRPDLPFSFRTGQRGKVWPTPTAHNAKEGAYPAEYERNTPTLAAQAGGSLNPTWVEWLMGWPLGWTALDALATDKYQQWRRSHGACLEVDDD